MRADDGPDESARDAGTEEGGVGSREKLLPRTGCRRVLEAANGPVAGHPQPDALGAGDRYLPLGVPGK